MAWIELHQSLPRHKKTLRLARLLKCERRSAWPLVAELWLWAVDNAPTGGPLSAVDIADAVEWDEDPNALAKALLDAGWLDEREGIDGYFIHDWAEYIQPLLDSREKNRERVRKWRNGGTLPVTNDVRNAYATHNETPSEQARNALRTPLPYLTEPNRTVPNPTKPNQEQTGAVGAVLTAAQTAAPGSEIRDEETENSNETTSQVPEPAKPSGTSDAGEKPRLGGSEPRSRSAVVASRAEFGTQGPDCVGDRDQRGNRATRSDDRNPAGHAPKAKEPALRRANLTPLQTAHARVEAGNAKSAAVNREWDVFGYALRRGAYVSEEQSRRMVAWGKQKNPHAIRIPFMQLMLARLLEGVEKQKAGELRNDDPVGYAIGWSINPDATKRQRPAQQATMKQAVEILNMADVSLAKNGCGHREWMDSLDAEINAMAKGMKCTPAVKA